MKKNIGLISVLAFCIVLLASCVQITAPTPQQVAPVSGTITQQTSQVSETMVQQTIPVSETIIQQTNVPIQTQPVQPIQQVQPIQPVQGGYVMPQFAITLDQAKNAALNAVGMSASNVVFTKQKQDYDDGMPEYEIEFVVNNMKYEFEVSGVNGAIIKQEIESVYN